MRRILLQISYVFVAILFCNLGFAQENLPEINKATSSKPKLGKKLFKQLKNLGIGNKSKEGIYPYIGNTYPGGGLAFGPGYRKNFGSGAAFDVHGAWSIRDYKMLKGSYLLPALSEKFRLRLAAGYTEADKVSYYGLGNDSQQSSETSYSFMPLEITIKGTYKATGNLSLGGGIGYLNVDLDHGNIGMSLEQRFDAVTAPGWGSGSSYLISSMFAEWNWISESKRGGGSYRMEWSDYHQQSGEGFGFHRLDLDLQQLVPIRENQVFAIRGLASFADGGRDEIPFYLMPSLGGKELRGFDSFRFRDRNRLLMTAEYRWFPLRKLEAFAFYEAGKVAAQASGLNFSDLHHSWGIGTRIHTSSNSSLRLEVARSVEGTRLLFGVGAQF